MLDPSKDRGIPRFRVQLGPGTGARKAYTNSSVSLRNESRKYTRKVNHGVTALLGHGWFPDSTGGGSLESDIHFDIAEDWAIGFAGPGFDIFTVAAHEIGHAIGLDHSTVPGSLMNSSYTEAFSGLQADDILGAQFIYGMAPVPFPIVVLPEPDTLVLLTTGLIGLAASRRKRTVTT